MLSKESINITFSHLKASVANIDFAVQGQGQSRIIILANYEGLESPMLHTNIRRNWPTGFGEEDYIYVHSGHLQVGHVTNKLSFPCA